MLINFQTFFL